MGVLFFSQNRPVVSSPSLKSFDFNDDFNNDFGEHKGPYLSVTPEVVWMNHNSTNPEQITVKSNTDWEVI